MFAIQITVGQLEDQMANDDFLLNQLRDICFIFQQNLKVMHTNFLQKLCEAEPAANYLWFALFRSLEIKVNCTDNQAKELEMLLAVR